jgi:hypothetical protein
MERVLTLLDDTVSDDGSNPCTEIQMSATTIPMHSEQRETYATAFAVPWVTGFPFFSLWCSKAFSAYK